MIQIKLFWIVLQHSSVQIFATQGKRIIYIYIYIYMPGHIKKERRHPGYQHYSSSTPSGGMQAADGGTHDDRDSEAQ
jgi:hypothetical protein